MKIMIDIIVCVFVVGIYLYVNVCIDVIIVSIVLYRFSVLWLIMFSRNSMSISGLSGLVVCLIVFIVFVLVGIVSIVIVLKMNVSVELSV